MTKRYPCCEHCNPLDCGGGHFEECPTCLRDQLDAARAEVAALREEVARLEARWLARTPSYGALRDRRDTLADLRAKVEGLAVRLTDDGVGTSLYLYVKRADVLALIEEAGK